MRDLLALLRRPQRSANELELQVAIERALQVDGWIYTRELRLSDRDRPDFAVEVRELVDCPMCRPDDPVWQAISGSVTCSTCGGSRRIEDAPVLWAVEVKVAGSVAEVERQLARYARHPEIAGLVLVSTRVRHAEVARYLAGKRVESAILADGAFL